MSYRALHSARVGISARTLMPAVVGARGFAAGPQVVTVGAAVMDMVAYVDRMPAVGETILGNSFGTSFGGKGANQAVIAGKLGPAGSSAMITKLGKDTLGEGYAKNFEDVGMSLDHVSWTTEASTGAAIINVDAEGNNQISVVMAANNLISKDDVDAARGAIAGAKILIGQLEIPREITKYAFEMARAEGTPTFLNTAPAPADPDSEDFMELVGLCDFINANEPEMEAMTGIKCETFDDCKAAAKVLLDRGAKNVIATLGERGAMLANAEHEGTVVSTTKVTAVDTIGAGDCFAGSFAYFHCVAGLPMVEAMERACQVASISVTKAGTQSAYPSIADLPPGLHC